MPERRAKQRTRCSFCGKPQDEVGRLIAGPAVYICDGCVRICNEIIAGAPPAIEPPDRPAATTTGPTPARAAPEQCSFCDRWEDQVSSLRPVPNVFVCDECARNVISSAERRI